MAAKSGEAPAWEAGAGAKGGVSSRPFPIFSRSPPPVTARKQAARTPGDEARRRFLNYEDTLLPPPATAMYETPKVDETSAKTAEAGINQESSRESDEEACSDYSDNESTGTTHPDDESGDEETGEHEESQEELERERAEHAALLADLAEYGANVLHTDQVSQQIYDRVHDLQGHHEGAVSTAATALMDKWTAMRRPEKTEQQVAALQSQVTRLEGGAQQATAKVEVLKAQLLQQKLANEQLKVEGRKVENVAEASEARSQHMQEQLSSLREEIRRMQKTDTEGREGSRDADSMPAGEESLHWKPADERLRELGFQYLHPPRPPRPGAFVAVDARGLSDCRSGAFIGVGRLQPRSREKRSAGSSSTAWRVEFQYRQAEEVEQKHFIVVEPLETLQPQQQGGPNLARNQAWRASKNRAQMKDRVKGLEHQVTVLTTQFHQSKAGATPRELDRLQKDMRHRHKFDLMRQRKYLKKQMHEDKVKANERTRRAIELMNAKNRQKKHAVYSKAAKGDAHRAVQAMQLQREDGQLKQQQERKRALHVARNDISRTIRRTEMKKKRARTSGGGQQQQAASGPPPRPAKVQRRSPKEDRKRERKEQRRQAHCKGQHNSGSSSSSSSSSSSRGSSNSSNNNKAHGGEKPSDWRK